jgi:hypothetical protein
VPGHPIQDTRYSVAAMCRGPDPRTGTARSESGAVSAGPCFSDLGSLRMLCGSGTVTAELSTDRGAGKAARGGRFWAAHRSCRHVAPKVLRLSDPLSSSAKPYDGKRHRCVSTQPSHGPDKHASLSSERPRFGRYLEGRHPAAFPEIGAELPSEGPTCAAPRIRPLPPPGCVPIVAIFLSYVAAPCSESGMFYSSHFFLTWLQKRHSRALPPPAFKNANMLAMSRWSIKIRSLQAVYRARLLMSRERKSRTDLGRSGTCQEQSSPFWP